MTTSRKVLPAGPAQVTIRGVGQSYPISVDCRSTSWDFLLFVGWTVTCTLRIRFDHGHACVRVYMRVFRASRDQRKGVRLAIFWRACSESRPVNVPSRLMTIKRMRRGLRILWKNRAAKKRAGNVTDNMLIRGCLCRDRWPTNSFPLPLKCSSLKSLSSPGKYFRYFWSL